MRVVFFGTPQFAVPTLNKLLQHPEMEVIGVVTQPDKPRGRGKKLIPSEVKKVAIENSLSLPIWQPKRIKKHRETLEKLKALNADVFVVVAYGQILSPEILSMPKLGCINVHGSILPKYRGAAPIQWSIYNGESITGITTMMMDEGMDTGNMLLVATTEIFLLDNAQQLAMTLSQQGGDLLIKTLLELENISPIPQNEEEATYAPPIQKTDYQLDWHKSAIALHNQVRAFFPNCFISWREKQLKIIATMPLKEAYTSQLPLQVQQLNYQLGNLTGEAGEIVSLAKNLGPVVATDDGLLLLTQVQLPGKRPQSGWDFVNGMRLKLGEKLS